MIRYLNSMLDLNLFAKELSEPESYGELVFKLKKIVDANYFQRSLLK